jgi:hypothetical protein
MPKFLQPYLGFLPFIPFFVLAYLMCTVPGFEYVAWAIIALAIGYWVVASFNTRKIFKNISEGRFPQLLAEFPVQATSEAEYCAARQKMEDFILSVEADQIAEVELTTAEVNHLYTKGKTPDKSKVILLEYYEINGGKIYEYSIRPAPFISWSGFWHWTHELSFLRQDDRIGEAEKRIEDNGKRIPQERQTAFHQRQSPWCKLLPAMFRLDKTLEWADRMELVLSKLQSIEVLNDQLLMRFLPE